MVDTDCSPHLPVQNQLDQDQLLTCLQLYCGGYLCGRTSTYFEELFCLFPPLQCTKRNAARIVICKVVAVCNIRKLEVDCRDGHCEYGKRQCVVLGCDTSLEPQESVRCLTLAMRGADVL